MDGHSKRHKVLVLTSSFPRKKGEWKGGFIYELSKRLCAEFDVIVLSPYVAGTPQKETWERMRIIRYKFLPFHSHAIFSNDGILPILKKHKIYWLTVPLFMLAQFFSLRKIVAEENITCIHAHWLIPQGIVAVLYKKIFAHNVSILATAHGSDVFALQGKIAVKFKKYVLRNVERLTVVSEVLKEEIKKIDESKNISVYPMGVDTKLFCPGENFENIKSQLGIKKELLLFVGRLAEEKGIKYLIAAMSEVRERFPEATLLIIGDGTLKQELSRMVEHLGLTLNVIFLGPLPHNELPLWFSASDVFILPSLFEGAGLVLYEALSCGSLVITSDIPVFSKVIHEGVTGFVVPTENRDLLAEKIIFVLENSDKYRAMRERCRAMACDTFDWDIIAKQYIEALKTLE